MQQATHARPACLSLRPLPPAYALLHSAGDHPPSLSAACVVLRALQQRDLSLMESLLSLERVFLRALNARRLAFARRLSSAQHARTACAAYRRRAG